MLLLTYSSYINQRRSGGEPYRRVGKPPANRNRVWLCGLLRLCTFFSLVRLLIAVVLEGDPAYLRELDFKVATLPFLEPGEKPLR